MSSGNPVPNNPVAKNMEKFNRPSVEKDKSKYSRKEKHKRKEDVE